MYNIPKMSHLFTNYNQYEQSMLLSAYNTISTLECWEYLKEYVVDPNKGFAMDTTPKIVNIMSTIQKDFDYCHSGCSMALTMRIMHDIAKNEQYK